MIMKKDQKPTIPPALAIFLVLILVIPLIAVYATSNSSPTDDTTNETSASPSPSPSASVPSVEQAISANEVILKTEMGDIRLTMYPNEAPKTVKNFVTLGNSGYYTNVVFHRIIKDFMIQGGDPTGTGRGGTSIYGDKFEDEINTHKIEVGTLAMANSGPDSNGSQFFIVTEQAQPGLDGGYTVFGQVSDEASMEVVRKIAAVPVTGAERSTPLTPPKMTGFEIVK